MKLHTSNKSFDLGNGLVAMASLSFLFASALGSMHSVQAEETVVEKVQTSVDYTTKDVKKTMRKGKKKIRNATGNSSTTEDVKDAGRNVVDSADATVKDVKRKVD